MSRMCIVCGASQDDDEIRAVHSFPQNKQRAQLWRQSMKIKYTGDLKGYRLCSKHFTPDSYKSPEATLLNHNAIPTLFPLTSNMDDPEIDPTEQIMLLDILDETQTAIPKCDFCFEFTTDSFQLMDESAIQSSICRNIFEFLFTDLELNPKETPQICTNCYACLFQVYLFKKFLLDSGLCLRKITSTISMGKSLKNVVFATPQDHDYLPNDTKPPSYLCDTCGEFFITLFNLNQHTCKRKPLSFVCHICNHTIRNISPQVHVRQVHTAKPYKCQKCERSFVYKDSLERHKERHTKPNVVCEICGQIVHKSGLQCHKRKHDTDNWFKCTVCKRNVSIKSREKHLKFHQNGGYKCLTCGAVLPTVVAFAEHTKNTHEKRGFYECAFCEMLFETERALKEHVTERHEIGQ
ncbi:zinc finger protein 836 isoform X2 [Tribolium castaneum]|uniref:zinc finger protein 836 isoform X2 n=1 Tax=Tribolium castaneum TaxID=7070 RepID=UPI00046C2D16|nr:PREDICTED: zinc finger protein 836 isoform X1 [Tribolium castaneum]|eukprot:XP_008194452.1 PREDICTED: zinc finger protein 836 isoform X1 [Tribolium castaneum]